MDVKGDTYGRERDMEEREGGCREVNKGKGKGKGCLREEKQ